MEAEERARLIGLAGRWGSLRTDLALAEGTAERLGQELREVERQLWEAIGPHEALKVGGLVLLRDRDPDTPPGAITSLRVRDLRHGPEIG